MAGIKKSDSKARDSHNVATEKCDYSVRDDCGSGGKYQELKTLGDFSEVTPGSPQTRLTDNCYKKGEKSKPEDVIGVIMNDTGGPPYTNTSKPKRIF